MTAVFLGKEHIVHKNEVFSLLGEQVGYPQNQASTVSTV